MACKCARCETIFLDSDIAEKHSPQCPICLASHYTDKHDSMFIAAQAKRSQASRHVVNGNVYVVRRHKWYYLCRVWEPTGPAAQCHAGDMITLNTQEARRHKEGLFAILDETSSIEPDTTEVVLQYDPATNPYPTDEEVRRYLCAETEGIVLETTIKARDSKERTLVVWVKWPAGLTG